jgi:hypothetical protein
VTPTEFYKTAEIDDSSPLRTTVDVRPFGDRQGEALDSYLHELGHLVASGTLSISKPIVVLHTKGIDVLPTFRPTINDRLGWLWAHDLKIQMQPIES